MSGKWKPGVLTRMKVNKGQTIFEKAEKEGRHFLFEHEVYSLLREWGIQTPRFVFVKKGERVGRQKLASLRSDAVVVKIVSPLIVHKTDVAGVAIVENKQSLVSRAVQSMLEEVPRLFLAKAKKSGFSKDFSIQKIQAEMRGVLVLEKVDYEDVGLGSELLVGIRHSREFGPIVTIGLGGLDVEYVNERLRERKALATNSVHLLQKKEIAGVLEPLAFHDKLVKEFRGRRAVLRRSELIETYDRFLKLALHFSPYSRTSPFVIEEAEVNPFVIRGGKLVPLDGMCRFSRVHPKPRPQIFQHIGRLLRPQSIGIIGVSERMNLGHFILNNILREGFPRERISVVKPGSVEIEGCRCVPTVSDLPETVDLFVLTLGAGQSVGVMEQLVASRRARSVVIIAGGMGEKKGTENLEAQIKSLLQKSRLEGKPTPIVNGGNCMGIYSGPGKYDTTFIPDYKLASPMKKNPRVVYISQSGAFMASRMSKFPKVEPMYAISLGNQIDLTASDYLNFFKDEEGAPLFALYIEGFQPGDGLALAKAAKSLIEKGKTVVVYKSGRTSEGRQATSGHTASVAGDYAVCRSVLEAAGVFVAESLAEFENSLRSLLPLVRKVPRGRRVGLISNAGFECVILADSLKDGYELELAHLTEETKGKIIPLLHPLGIDRLQDIRNPLDITPVSDDAVFAGCVETLLADENVDCAVVSPVPMTSALQTLAPGGAHNENIHAKESIGQRLIDIFRRTAKPFVVNIDAGAFYQPLVDVMEEAGVPTFRRSDEALRFLSKYVNMRLRAK